MRECKQLVGGRAIACGWIEQSLVDVKVRRRSRSCFGIARGAVDPPTPARDLCDSDLRQTSPYLRPCRCESDRASRRSSLELPKCRNQIATVPGKYQRCPFAILETTSCPNPLAQQKRTAAAPENRAIICDPLPRLGALVREDDPDA